MFILFGIISAIVLMAAEYFFGLGGEGSLLSLVILRFIPAGAIGYGMFIGYSVAFGVKVQNKQPKNKLYGIFAAIIAIIVFVGSGYLEFATTYVDDNGIINRDFEGAPISEFVYETENGEVIEMNFINFTKYSLETSSLVESSKYSSNDKIIETSFGENLIRYVLQLLALPIVALLMTVGVLSSSKYCDECRRYHKNKKLYTFYDDDYNEELNELLDKSSTDIGLSEFIKKKRKGNKYGGIFYNVSIEYCQGCNEGLITYTMGKSGSKNTSIAHTTEIQGSQVRNILNSI